jgi:hypothetical protein
MKLYYVARRQITVEGVGSYTELQYIPEQDVELWKKAQPPLEDYIRLNLVLVTDEEPKKPRKVRIEK